MEIVPKKDKNVFAILQGQLSSGGHCPWGNHLGGKLAGSNFPWESALKPLTRWPKPTQEEIIRLCFYHTIFVNFFKLCVSQTKNCLDSCFLQLILLFKGLFLLLIQYSLFNIFFKV